MRIIIFWGLYWGPAILGNYRLVIEFRIVYSNGTGMMML